MARLLPERFGLLVCAAGAAGPGQAVEQKPTKRGAQPVKRTPI